MALSYIDTLVYVCVCMIIYLYIIYKITKRIGTHVYTHTPHTFSYHTTPFTWNLFTTSVVGCGIKFPQIS